MQDYRGLPIWVENYMDCVFGPFGRGPTYDCWGFVRLIYRDLCGIELPMLLGQYDSCSDRRKLPGLFDAQIAQDWVEIWQPQPLDCAVFKIFKYKMHVAVMISDTWLFHMEQDIGPHIESVDEALAGRRLDGFYRHVDRT